MRNETLKTTDLLSLLALLCVVFGLSAAIVLQEWKDADRQLALNEAKNLAFQLVNSDFVVSQKLARRPASLGGRAGESDSKASGYDGVIGKDPWGQPFRYRLVKDQDSKATHILVWSSGMNLKFDSEEVISQKQIRRFQGAIHLHEDDLGFAQVVEAATRSAVNSN